MNDRTNLVMSRNPFSSIFILAFFTFSFFSVNAQNEFEEEASNLAFVKFNDSELLKEIQSISSEIKFIDHKGETCNLTIHDKELISGQMKSAFPDHRSFDISFMDDKNQEGKIIISPDGVYCIYQHEKGMVVISPTDREGIYQIERNWEADPSLHSHMLCAVDDHNHTTSNSVSNRELVTNGDFLRELDMALVVTAEYYEANGNNQSEVLSWIMMNMEGLNLIFENELSCTFILDDRIVIYDDIENDPFISNGDPDSDNRISLAQEIISGLFDFDEYDIGHVLHNSSINDDFGGGGIAGLNALCSQSNFNDLARKAAGWSGSFNNQSSGFIGLFAHEIGHMFGAQHTFNGTGRSCTDNISSNNSYEIGSGSTIMSYQGICDSQYNIPNSSANFDYFHVASLYQMISHLNNIDCHDVGNHTNNIPEIEINPCGLQEFVIPVNTPFVLRGEATDLDGDDLTYAWEQFDEDGLDTLTKGFIGEMAASSPIAPIFRSYPPGPSPERQIPSQETLLAGDNPFEVLSLVPREINMRFTVRDNKINGGAVAIEEMKIDVIQAGPVVVTSPAAGDNMTTGTATAVEWDTNGAEDLCDLVDIYLSRDGGVTFDVQLARNIPFEIGTAILAVPAGLKDTENAVVKVACNDNDCFYFFNTSEEFNIISNCDADITGFCGDNLSFEGERGTDDLILDVPPFFANERANEEFYVDDNSFNMNVARWTINGDCETMTFSSGNNVRIATDSIEFYVSQSGNYTFTPENIEGSFKLMNVYQADIFDENNLCASRLGGNASESTANPGTTSTSASFGFSADLEACTKYIFTAGVFSGVANFILQLDGPGEMIEYVSPQTGTSFTYVAIDDNTGLVSAFSDNADFRSLAAGTYDVQAVQYADNENPDNWIGRDLFTIFEDCLSVGNNEIDLTVLPGEDIEICDNDIDDDGDGFIDCEDPDLADDCCCLEPELISIIGDTQFCQGEIGVLTAIGNFESFLWSTGESGESISIAQEGVYIVAAEDPCGLVAEASIEVEVIDGDFEEDLNLQFCQGDEVEVNGEVYTEAGTLLRH